MPQKSKLQQVKDSQAAAEHSKPTSQPPHQRTQYTGGKSPSHVEKVLPLGPEPKSHYHQPNPDAPAPVDIGRSLSTCSSIIEPKPHLSVYPQSPPELNFTDLHTARESHSSSTYSKDSASGGNLCVYDNTSIHNYEDTSVILGQSSNARDPMTVISKDSQISTVPDIQVVPPSSPELSHLPAKLGHEELDELELLRSRLRSTVIFDDRDQNLSIGKRQFDSIPHLVNKLHPHQLEEGCQSEIVEDHEVLRMQQKYSRVLLFLCCLFPPLLYVLAYGVMDHMMLSFTDGRVAHVGVFYKRVAFFVGTAVGSICCCIPIVCGVLTAKGAL